jgi:hypothetical protein
MERKPTDLAAGPYIDPSITDPAALAYKQQLEARNRARSPGAGVPIPRLDTEAVSGMTMADQAVAARQPPPGAVAPAGSSFFQQPAQQQASVGTRPPANILPNDLLPEAAAQDPAYREGQGARYAASQPHLAYKYGVIRNGTHLVPQQLQSGNAGLRPETLKDLQTIEQLQRVREQAESSNARVEAEAASGPGAAAARLANPNGSNDVRPATDTDRETVKKALENLDDFDFNTYREMMMRDIINNEEQKTLIESRLQPLELTDIIMNGRVTQVAPIVVGKFEPEFQSMSGEEDLALKRLLMEEAKGIDVNSRYLLDKFSLMSVALGLYAINKVPLPAHTDNEGRFDDAKFWVKFNKVVRFPFHMLSSLGVHYFWFDIRVRKLFVGEKLGNG